MNQWLHIFGIPVELFGTILEIYDWKNMIARNTDISKTIFSPLLAGRMKPTKFSIDNINAGKTKLKT